MNLYMHAIATVDFNLYLSSEASCELDPNNVINVKYFLKMCFLLKIYGDRPTFNVMLVLAVF